MPERPDEVRRRLYLPWADLRGITHRSWSRGEGYGRVTFTLCNPERKRQYNEGQGIGGALVTCIACWAAS